MAEIKILIDGKTVAYSGLFRMDELYGIMRRYFKERGYFLVETQNQEDVLESGKQVVLKLEPEKTLSDYAKSKLVTVVHVKGLQDRTVTVDGHKQKLITDHRSRWEGSGGAFLLRTIMNKFIKRDVIHTAEANTKKDANELLDEIRSYLNMTRFKMEHHDPQKTG